jgi:uncharacterized protein (DUF1499 family)
MTIATASSATSRSVLRHIPLLAAALAVVAVVLLGAAPLGWRAGWWHYRFALLTLLPWAAYFGLAAAGAAVLAVALGRSRIGGRGAALAAAAFVAGGLVAYVPWHYDAMRRIYPPINDITTDTENPPAFLAVLAARKAEGGNPADYAGAKVAEQQHRAYPDIAPLILALPPDRAFSRALDTAQRMGWTIVAADPVAGRIEASDRSRWFGFTDDIVIRITPSGSDSRIDMRSSSRFGRGDFGVNATRVRDYLTALRHAAGPQS